MPTRSKPVTNVTRIETVAVFARRIRRRYPGAFDRVPDRQLVAMFLARHPVYARRLWAPVENSVQTVQS